MKSKLAVTAFVLAITGIALPILNLINRSFYRGYLLDKFVTPHWFWFYLSLWGITLIISIVSIKIIKKHNLEGKGLAMTALIISAILFVGIPLILLMLFILLLLSGPM